MEILVNKYPDYKEIGEIIYEYDYFDDDLQVPFPTMTSISRRTGKTFGKVRKQIKEIHDLIFSENDNNLNFGKVQYRMCFSYGENYFEFNLKNLPVIPRVGENLQLPFIKANIMTDLFYVEEVQHVFKNSTQIVEIWCKSGAGNQYLKFRKDKAQALREIRRDELNE